MNGTQESFVILRPIYNGRYTGPAMRSVHRSDMECTVNIDLITILF